MPTLIFERTDYVVVVPEGGRVLDVCDQHPAAGIPFACRAANCGICRVEVTEGLQHCEPPEDDERELLAQLGHHPRVRLGCQLRVRPGDGRIRLRTTQ